MIVKKSFIELKVKLNNAINKAAIKVETLSWQACILLALAVVMVVAIVLASAMFLFPFTPKVPVPQVPIIVEPSAPKPDIFEQNKLVFKGPHWNFNINKPDDLALEIWARYSTMDPACRGASMLDSDDTRWFAGATGEHMGTAKRQYLVPANKPLARLILPLFIDDPRQCLWDLDGFQIYGYHPFTAKAWHRMKRTDVFWLRLKAYDVPIDIGEIVLSKYEITCNKGFFVDGGGGDFYYLECNFSNLNKHLGISSSIKRSELEKEQEIQLDIKLSKGIVEFPKNGAE